jgi:sulfur relay (sulfurtransferase) DsrC/TusE family protein
LISLEIVYFNREHYQEDFNISPIITYFILLCKNKRILDEDHANEENANLSTSTKLDPNAQVFSG